MEIVYMSRWDEGMDGVELENVNGVKKCVGVFRIKEGKVMRMESVYKELGYEDVEVGEFRFGEKDKVEIWNWILEEGMSIEEGMESGRYEKLLIDCVFYGGVEGRKEWVRDEVVSWEWSELWRGERG